MKTTKTFLILSALFLLIVTRFVNLTWGQPFFFHPDERNIASSVSQLLFPNQLNPHFFAYGSLPIYLIYFSGLFFNFLTSCHMQYVTCRVSFEQALIISRVFSAIFSCLSIFLLFLISNKITSEKHAWVVVFLSIFCTGFIQFSHFGTFEMWTIFFSLLLCYLLMKQNHHQYKHILLLGLITGTLIAIKIANLVFLPLILTSLFLPFAKSLHSKHLIRFTFLRFLKQLILFLLVIGAVYGLTNPYTFLDTKEFLSSITYETQVATGKLPVFYTQEFFGTIPVIYQLLYVFPFLLNPILTFLSPIIFLGFLLSTVKTRRKEHGIIVLFFLFSFLPQAILFTKWTRYMVTCLPFFFLMIPTFLEILAQKKKLFYRPVLILLLCSSMVFSLSYFSLVFLGEDVRMSAAQEAGKRISPNATILSEVYDLGIVPFNQNFLHIILFNFYDIETDSSLQTSLSQTLADTDYVILPSQRLIKNRLSDPHRFPKGHAFYQEVTNPNIYQKIYQTPCDILCNIVYLGDPISRLEGTATVFDRPIVQIYKKL